MSYKLIYTIPYASLNNEACVLEIEKEGYTGLAIELTGSESPFEVEIDDNDFLYAPIRFSTARIRVVGSDYLQELYSTSYQQYRVTFKRDGIVTWCGFVKPEVYTQDYSSDKFELEIECMSAMSVLEFINYKQVGDGTRVFVSFWDLFKKCIVSAKGQYSAIYIPHVYAKDAASYTSGLNVFTDMSVSEQNFFDEDDKPMKLKEVLEEMCKFLNWTCVDYLGELYFVDMDHDGEYYRYNLDMTVFSKVDSGPVLNVQKVGFAGNDHALDFLPGYNKCVVRTSNYLIPDFEANEDYDKLKEAVILNTKDDKPFEKAKYHAGRKVILLPDKIDMRQYLTGYGDYISPLSKETVIDQKENANNFLGAMPVRLCSYDIENGTPNINEYNYTDAIQIRIKPAHKGLEDSFNLGDRPILVIKGPNMLYSEGAFCISCDYAFTVRENLSATIDNDKYWDSKLRCSLRIGSKYFNGEFFGNYENPYIIGLRSSNSNDDWVSWRTIKNEKPLDSPYTGMIGFFFETALPLNGELEFIIYSPDAKRWNGTEAYRYPYGMFVKNLKIQYKAADSIYNKSKNDRYYENIVNEDYINELDEIEFKISSHNNDGSCYSKVLLLDEYRYKYLTDNLYSSVMGEPTRPEEQLIHRIINRYSATHVKLTQVIKETPKLTPLTKLSDNFMVDKKFMPIGGSIDYKTGQYRCIMVDV